MKKMANTTGIQTYPVPEWDKWQKDGVNAELNNKLICNRRPYFMKYVYSRYAKKYKHHWNAYENVCEVRLGFSLETLLAKDEVTGMEQKIREEFYERSPLINSNSIMNLLCHYAENKIKELKFDSKKTNFDYRVYMNPNFPVDENKLDKISLLLGKWQAFQRNSHDRPMDEFDEEEIQSKDEYIKVLEREAYAISNNLSELTNLLIILCYEKNGENSKDFAWRMFDAKGIIDNLIERSNGFIQVPIVDESGSYEYLGKRFIIRNVVLENDDAESFKY